MLMCLLCLLALTEPGSGFLLQSAADRAHLAAATAVKAEWAACAKADSEDRRFWAAEWASLEAMLRQLQEAATGAPHSQSLLLVQQANASGSNAKSAVSVVQGTGAKVNGTNVKVNSTSAKANGTAAMRSSTGSQPNGTSKARRTSPLAGLKLNLNPKSKADLMPALGMLKSLYEDGKQRIAQLNAREKKSKADFEEKETRHKARIAQIEARVKNHTLSEEFSKNETFDENRLFKYWQGVRERQHRQFHTSLKLQHGTLNKVKNMIEVYEKTLSGKADKAEIKKDLANVGVAPVVVLLQKAWREQLPFLTGALEEVRKARAELRRGAPAA